MPEKPNPQKKFNRAPRVSVKDAQGIMEMAHETYYEILERLENRARAMGLTYREAAAEAMINWLNANLPAKNRGRAIPWARQDLIFAILRVAAHLKRKKP